MEIPYKQKFSDGGFVNSTQVSPKESPPPTDRPLAHIGIGGLIERLAKSDYGEFGSITLIGELCNRIVSLAQERGGVPLIIPADAIFRYEPSNLPRDARLVASDPYCKEEVPPRAEASYRAALNAKALELKGATDTTMVRAVLHRFGFDRLNDVTDAKLQEVCNALDCELMDHATRSNTTYYHRLHGECQYLRPHPDDGALWVMSKLGESADYHYFDCESSELRTEPWPAQPTAEMIEFPEGEVLGQPYPDWPSDLHTFQERKAFQRGVAAARQVGSQIANGGPAYAALREVLDMALEQASIGKGKERHAPNDERFEDQRMLSISRLLASEYGMAYQVCKKVSEGLILPTTERKVAELLGAINYIAGIVIYLREKDREA